MLDSQVDRNKLRAVVNKALDDKHITKEDAGFAVMLAERFRADIDRKVKQVHIMQGELAQLRANEKIIVDLLNNIIAAAERDAARLEAEEQLRADTDEEKPKKGKSKKQ